MPLLLIWAINAKRKVLKKKNNMAAFIYGIPVGKSRLAGSKKKNKRVKKGK